MKAGSCILPVKQGVEKLYRKGWWEVC